MPARKLAGKREVRDEFGFSLQNLLFRYCWPRLPPQVPSGTAIDVRLTSEVSSDKPSGQQVAASSWRPFSSAMPLRSRRDGR